MAGKRLRLQVGNSERWVTYCGFGLEIWLEFELRLALGLGLLIGVNLWVGVWLSL